MDAEIDAFQASLDPIADMFKVDPAGALDIVDENGVPIARFSEYGLQLNDVLSGPAVETDRLHVENALEITELNASGFSQGDTVFTDEAGFVLFVIPGSGGADTGTGAGDGDFRAEEIGAENARALGIAALTRSQVNGYTASLSFGLNHLFVDGQSLGQGWEGWPVKTTAGRSDVLMIGQSVRPGGAYDDSNPSPVGDAVLRPAVATA
ncbi:hypothetical protein [Methylobacterium nodulans]|uniref:hypothetical protein n=1 Tax=Methylobacterium nodulans TaxID=114616 RepID=UPI0012EEA379|nr:hypothetical protein [Methylobacterium nodulans]